MSRTKVSKGKVIPNPINSENPLGYENYADTDYIIDSETGEIKTEILNFETNWLNENNYIKVYYDVILKFHDISSIPVGFICEIGQYVSYADKNMEIHFNPEIKERICEHLKISMSMVNKWIHRCVEVGILFKTRNRGSFLVNPFIIARGKLADIRNLQCNFSFMDGKWQIKRTELSDNRNEIDIE